jgi:hypothetical protein
LYERIVPGASLFAVERVASHSNLRQQECGSFESNAASSQNDYPTKKGHVIDMAPLERTAAACLCQRKEIATTRNPMT